MTNLGPLLLALAATRPGALTIQDGSHRLRLRLNLQHGCVVDGLDVKGTPVLDARRGLSSGIEVGGRWYTSQNLLQAPRVVTRGRRILVDGIVFGGGGVRVSERWTFDVGPGSIRWKIDRKYLSSGVLDDTAMPAATFRDMTTWTGALLGTGGVAWGKLFDAPNATYGVHTGAATFWNPRRDACLRFQAQDAPGSLQALRFTREPEGGFTMASEVTRSELKPKQDLALFRRERQDVWAPFPVSAGETVSATFDLRSFDYSKAYGRGDFKGLDTGAIAELLNTIGRIGVIDRNLVGSNGWYSGYVCLHEPWVALANVAIDDPDYLRTYARALDYARDHALMPDGMVKSRWSYNSGDSTPGTYNRFGFYEAQWGRLMDTQTSYATDVADQFDQSGDLGWLRGQKSAVEAALGYLLRRDSNGNHLVEMENDSIRQRRSSDWLDIVWASHENALVNAQLYGALQRWAPIERLLKDERRAAYYRGYAAKLKASFNRPISQGGFWNPAKGWYVYWRDRDGSVHGDNLTVPVNLTALGEGLCDDPARRKTLLGTIEAKMRKESLLAWPACFEPFAPDEGQSKHFPDYENGDIFLAWAEYGVRAYAADEPAIALKYVRQIVSQYKKDGLAFQRYLRASQTGAGDDILANNCQAIVGLYRDLYGIQPKYDRLLLDPHLPPELNGTRVDYVLRGRRLAIDLSAGRYRVRSGGASVASSHPFGVDFAAGGVTFFPGRNDRPSMFAKTEGPSPISMEVGEWGRQRSFSFTGGARPDWLALTFYGLDPHRTYRLRTDGNTWTVPGDRSTVRVYLAPHHRLSLRLTP